MNKRLLLMASAFIGIVLTVGVMNGLKRESSQPDTQKSGEMDILKGFSLSPRSYQSSDFTGFFEKAKQAGGAVSWAGDWSELAKAVGGPEVVVALGLKYGLAPVVEAQFFTQSSGELLRQLNESTRRLYMDAAVAFAEKHKPKYLALGVEVNALYERSPADFEEFMRFYGEVYDAVKAKSPGTKVFTVFQLERMKGLGGGLYGGVNDPAEAQWHLLEEFNKSDLAAFTTYPGLIYKSPSEIPVSHYSEIRSHTSKPIAFTEVGWHSAPSPVGWESSEAEQAEFLRIFMNLTRDLRPELLIWSFMYDQETFEPFNSMGLLQRDGKAKPAWNDWLAMK